MKTTANAPTLISSLSTKILYEKRGSSLKSTRDLIVRSLNGKNWQDRDITDKVSISFPATPKDHCNVFRGVMKKFEKFITLGG